LRVYLHGSIFAHLLAPLVAPPTLTASILGRQPTVDILVTKLRAAIGTLVPPTVIEVPPRIIPRFAVQGGVSARASNHLLRRAFRIRTRAAVLHGQLVCAAELEGFATRLIRVIQSEFNVFVYKIESVKINANIIEKIQIHISKFNQIFTS
jgi:hypothetical protein